MRFFMAVSFRQLLDFSVLPLESERTIPLLLSPKRRRCAVDHAQERGMSERRACRLVNQPRGTQRYRLIPREDEDALTGAIVELASQYGRYGYRRITALLQRDGWKVGKDRVERIWRREGLKGSAEAKSLAAGCGSTMDRACGCARSTPTMYGLTIS
jgi:hypothetical protein